MCIVFYTLSHPGYKLILASNRDEFLDKPTAPASWHTFEPYTERQISNAVPPQEGNGQPTTADGDGSAHASGNGNGGTNNNESAPSQGDRQEPWILSGRDMTFSTGGTWLGMTRDLRVAVLTNIRIPPVPIPPNAPSRGLLLKEFLAAPPSSSLPSVHEYLASHQGSIDQYEGFNLLLFHLHPPSPSSPINHQINIEGSRLSSKWAAPEMGYLSNRPVVTMTDIHSPTRVSTPIPDIDGKKKEKVGQCWGMSNSPMMQPWPKVSKGEERMSRSLEQWAEEKEGEDELVERMMDLLQPSVPLNSLADLRSCTCLHPFKLGANPDEPIKPDEKGRWYGTRVSTVILVKESGEVTFVERDIFVQNEQGEAVPGKEERRYSFLAHGVAPSG